MRDESNEARLKRKTKRWLKRQLPRSKPHVGVHRSHKWCRSKQLNPIMGLSSPRLSPMPQSQHNIFCSRRPLQDTHRQKKRPPKTKDKRKKRPTAGARIKKKDRVGKARPPLTLAARAWLFGGENLVLVLGIGVCCYVEQLRPRKEDRARALFACL